MAMGMERCGGFTKYIWEVEIVIYGLSIKR